MLNRRKGLFCGLFVLAATLSLTLLIFPAPSPWNQLLLLAELAFLYWACYFGEEPGARRIHEPKVYYLMTIVVLAAIALTVLLGGLAFERGGWLTVFAVFEFALCLPLYVYIIVAFVLPE